MLLQMYIGEKLIDAVFISEPDQGKVNIMQQQLENKHNDIIELSDEEPKYFLEGVASRACFDTHKGGKETTYLN
jgi:hypothetical protein